MYKPNPKQIGSNLISCKVQQGKCPRHCYQCYYNRDEELYPINIPSKLEAKGKIVRMNSLHDSNYAKELVIAQARKYKDVFFNTSIASFDFPGPVVYTANPNEECPVDLTFLQSPFFKNIMFIRLRVSSTNLHHLWRAVLDIGAVTDIPIVLTFMAYYDEDMSEAIVDKNIRCYVWKTRHVNKYWCATAAFKKHVLQKLNTIGGGQLTMCGMLDSDYCRDCRNCEAYYWLAKRRLIYQQ